MALSMALLFMIAFQLLVAAGTELKRWSNDTSGFVTTKNGEFQLNGRTYRFYGTNAYWLQMLSDEDMDKTFRDIASADFKVVRTWAFNDVAQKPSNGTYFQILQNGAATINEGPDGLQRLDKVVATAQKYDIKLILTLTNNWNPERQEPSVSFKRWEQKNVVLPRGYLSNDYGGIDLYDRNFVSNPTHDDFYTNPVIISAFKNYTSHVVQRYVNNPSVLAWELANDPRCSSNLPASSTCNTTTITNWVAEIASFVKSLDSTHLVTAGDGGFYCIGCPKIYASSSSDNQVSPGGPTFDGSFGVDTEDIISVPSIDFGSFQLFPDQVHYFPGHDDFPRGVPNFASTAIIQGNSWVTRHTATANTFNKPEALTAFGIVTKDNWPFFVPFNSSSRMPDDAPCRGVERFDLQFAFTSWAMVGFNGDIGGMLEYQWLERGLLDVPNASGRKRQLYGNNSPNDGYSNLNYVPPDSGGGNPGGIPGYQ
jgi:mannan endo-1,4-beta-mannosidase